MYLKQSKSKIINFKQFSISLERGLHVFCLYVNFSDLFEKDFSMQEILRVGNANRLLITNIFFFLFQLYSTCNFHSLGTLFCPSHFCIWVHVEKQMPKTSFSNLIIKSINKRRINKKIKNKSNKGLESDLNVTSFI